jgi:hypothetical protein
VPASRSSAVRRGVPRRRSWRRPDSLRTHPATDLTPRRTSVKAGSRAAASVFFTGASTTALRTSEKCGCGR